jgi:pimeloyl-ACP methyl ester carboxylesterase
LRLPCHLRMALRYRRVISFASFLVGSYVLVVAVFWGLQDRLVFPRAGAGDRGVPIVAGAASVVVERLVRSDGGISRVVVLEPSPQPRGVVLCFVGNGEDLTSAAFTGAQLLRYGLTVVGVEHPGYGSSDGPPGVATLMGGAEAAAEHGRGLAAERGVPLYALGSSLGTFCAVHVAATAKVAGLVLRAPPATLARAAKARFGWLPIDWLLRHSFDNLTKAGQVRCPTLILHGDGDRIVPPQEGRELAAAIGANARFHLCKGYGHNDLPLDRQGPFGSLVASYFGDRQ